MVIIYGFGQHMNAILEDYCIPINEIECIIDNGLSERSIYIGDIKIISFESYLSNRDTFKSDKMVVGAKARFQEIKDELLKTGYFWEENIIYVDEWIKNFPRTSDFLNGSVAESRKKDLRQMCNQVGLISDNALKNAKLLNCREAACYSIPLNSVVAEIGVAFGDFSKKILQIAKPRKFYAIDMFSEKTTGFWGKNIFYENNMTHEEWYKQNFNSYIKNEVMEIRKGISWECMEQFPDNYFDYVYLDAAHDYNSVSKDINILKQKVKEGGMIQFNDYNYRDWYGVVPAVNELIRDTGSEVLFYCLSIDNTNDIVVKLNKYNNDK
ncbi:class I SAM-dependent methyltransferase [Parablautia intestinalis]|uniref:Class I SAM-dependent methyltransferase n=1 Tax=Parablautia intestinalis TaxID=2320100 RepID=A0A3A9A831_9FIRM|nr:class I SAM-dependent methyltransferase [Parablautia intestinalis]RKI87619.1 class I SAM-dependent methyltransferase [Parablautia intestinalis]